MYSIEQFVYESGIAKDLRELQGFWTNFVAQFGASGYRIVPISSHVQMEKELQPDIAYKAPQGWIDLYKEQGLHRYDSVLKKEIVDRGPFSWAEARSEYSSPESKRMVDKAKEFGVSNGISMSLWLGPNELVAIGLYISTKKIVLDDTAKRMLLTASFLFCSRYKELNRLPGFAESLPIELSPRERDVLYWIALGKTKQEIADILLVSASCIKRHCENASNKLGVNNMASAVATAISQGLVLL